MATVSNKIFARKPREADLEAGNYDGPMINTIMDRGEWIIFVALALIWGAAFFFIKVAVTHVEPLTYVWLRVLIAGAGLWAYLRLRGERLALPWQIWSALFVLALFNNVIPFALFGWGQRYISSGLGSILNATTPIWGVVVAHYFLTDERMSPAKLLGVIIGFLGVATMIGLDAFAGDADALPQLACVIATLCYAIAGVWARRFKPLGITPMKVATGQLVIGALVMTPIALIADQPWLKPLPPLEAWGAIAVLALVCSAYAYVLYFKLIDSAGATNALLVTLLVPPVAIIMGAVFLGEQMTGAQMLGLTFIALGLAVIDGRLFAAFRRRAFA